MKVLRILGSDRNNEEAGVNDPVWSQVNIPLDVLILPHAGGLPLPQYESSGASGLDLRAALAEQLQILPGTIALIPTGLCVGIPPGWEGQIRSRSGVAASGLIVGNSPGTVDSDFRGEVKVILLNLSSKSVEILRGERIAQLVLSPVGRATWNVVESLPPSNRQDQGFGSTGVS